MSLRDLVKAAQQHPVTNQKTPTPAPTLGSADMKDILKIAAVLQATESYKIAADTLTELNNKLVSEGVTSTSVNQNNIDQVINELNILKNYKNDAQLLSTFNSKLANQGFNAINSTNIVETVNTFKAYQVNSTLFSELNDSALKIGLNAPIDQYNIDDSINTLGLESAKADGFDIATRTSGLRGKNDTFDHIGSVVKQTLDHIIDYCTPKHGTNNTLCIDICESGFNFNNAWDDCA